MPSSFRRRLEDGAVVTKGQDGQLFVYPVDVFQEKASEVMERKQDRGGRRFSRTVFGGADLQKLDKSGRVLVKPDLRSFAQIVAGTEVAVVGVFDHVELWEKETFVGDREKGDEYYLEEEDEED